MAGARLWSSIRAALRRRDEPLFLNDSSAFDFSDEAAEDCPRFNKLRVVVSDDVSDAGPEPPANGAHLGPPPDRDSLLLRGAAPGARPDPCHGCRRQRERGRQAKVKRRLSLAAVLYLLFMAGELVEVLSAIISVLLVYILMAFLLYEAVQRTIHMDYEINGDIMLITAAVGVAVNLIMGFLLNQSGHLHSHSHTHSHVPPSSSPNTALGNSQGPSSLAVRAAFVHALGDLVQSIGVLIAAYIIRFKPEYKIADPICTYIFSVLVIFTTVRIICDTGVIILEGVPKHLNMDRIKEDLMKIEDVYSIEDLNVWSLTAGKTSAIVHLQLVPGSSSKWEEVQSKARHLLLNTFGMYKCSVQLQSYKQEVNKTCANCQSSSA
ncbi:probable proton-coupled zinc antiporter SLC30A4 isoform X2 [Alligator mississippiensis]|uniref:probable proton-coupled zinc antiporter SLC30A4 isoform X2 n=1 Tax=Alligator mississippiensis TaxID=8496 RepID=UPI0028774BB3|nr:probable proton-coupled zinc antiporter SLC30A4 isoform X2 [Alligator mississippiensis]